MDNKGFATLDNIKGRLAINDTVDDVVLQEILESSAGAIENCVGRPLRRRHSRTEIFAGGTRLLLLKVYPIVKIYSVRESETRDFVDSDNYDELVEGTDYVIEPSAIGDLPGASGQLRRLNQDWLGSERSPGRVQVSYAGGFRADEEIALANSSILIAGQNVVQDFECVKVQDTYSFFDRPDNTDKISFADQVAVLRFATGDQVFPTWDVWSILLRFHLANEEVSPAIDAGYVSTYGPTIDPSFATAESLFLAAEAATEFGTDPAASLTVDAVATFSYAANSEDFTEKVGTSLNTIVPPGVESFQSKLAATLQLGYAAFSIYSLGPPASATDTFLAGANHSTSSFRPSLSLSYRNSIDEIFDVPDDLRHANLLQAITEWQNRKSPGRIQQSMRGAGGSAAGSSWSKSRMALLPEVRDICAKYKPLFY